MTRHDYNPTTDAEREAWQEYSKEYDAAEAEIRAALDRQEAAWKRYKARIRRMRKQEVNA